MRAFLSHSSADKDFVEPVAGLMRPGSYELDSTTFDAGLVNSEAIRIALSRSDLFCLFLSRASVSSRYVEFETLLGVEFLARGSISRFIAICLDEEAFSSASENVKFFNIVRKSLSPDSAALLIQGQLISASTKSTRFSHPFLGRDEELKSLDGQVSDHRRPHIKALYLSGNAGTGRRSLASKFYENHFPHVGQVFPTITISEFDGPDELYRNVLTELRPTMTAGELRTRMQSLAIVDTNEKLRMTADLLNSILPSNYAVFLVDDGGVLTDAGAFTPELEKIIDALESHPHPPATIVSPRMVPRRYRTSRQEIAFVAIKALDWDPALRLMSALLKRHKIDVDSDSLEELTKLSDGHPFNFYHLVEEVVERGVKPFLANPLDFIEWKQGQTSEYVERIAISTTESAALALLKSIPELDFDTIATALNIAGAELAIDLQRLVLLHVLDSDGGRFRISPALRVAIERDARIRMPAKDHADAMSSVAQSPSLRIEEGTAPTSLVDSAVLANIESGNALTELAGAFLLPSHYVRLAKVRYDQHRWSESIRFGLEALKGEARLSSNGLVEVCRLLCLAGARVGENDVSDRAIRKLQDRMTDDWARSNVAYLKGFQLRMRGQLPAAQTLFQSAYDYHNGNNSAMRELAAIALARGDLDKAEDLARKAYSYARTNAYLVDMLLTVLIRKRGSAPKSSEIEDLFAVLERVGGEDGRSFYATRRAEYEYLWGDNKSAAQFIEQAVSKTPAIFEVRRLQAEIYLKAGNRNRANEAIQAMTRMVGDHEVYDRRRNYRLFLETKAHYLTAFGQYDEAKNQYNELAYFTAEERSNGIKEIEKTQAFASARRER